MTTANAITNENGYHLSGHNGFGRPLSSNDIYSDKSQSDIQWKYKESQILTKIKYHADALTGIGGMRLIQELKANDALDCHIYESIKPRHVAIHCPELEKVIIIMGKGNYVIRKEENFTGRKP